jgi:hypothetical protein
LLILDLWGISFHAVVVFGLDKKLLFKSILGHCVLVNNQPTQLNCFSGGGGGGGGGGASSGTRSASGYGGTRRR